MSLPAGTTKSGRIRPALEYVSGWSAEKAGAQAVHVASCAIWEFEPIVSRSSLFQEKPVIYWFLIFSFFSFILFLFSLFGGVKFPNFRILGNNAAFFPSPDSVQGALSGLDRTYLEPHFTQGLSVHNLSSPVHDVGILRGREESSYELRSQSALLASCLYLFLEPWLTVLAQDKIWSGRWLCKIDIPKLILLTKIFPLRISQYEHTPLRSSNIF